MMNLLYQLYFGLPRLQFLGKGSKAIDRILAFVTKRVLDAFVPAQLRRTAPTAGSGVNEKSRAVPFIVSMTSFPARIDEVWITVETLLRQSYKPDALILWLSEEQFPDRQVPESLTKLVPRGLTIEFVPGDIRSHKKYFYAFERFPEAAIITVDDDVYYPKNTLKYLADAFAQHPDCVIANRAHTMTFADTGLKPYRQWRHNDKPRVPSALLVPTGVGGVLYPPGSYHPDIFDEATFRAICFMADDLWLKVATLRNGYKVATTPFFTRDLLTTGHTQRVKLVADNSHGGGNDVQLAQICARYELDLTTYRPK
ncbi:MAG TPA: hypothetical protein VK183_01670 [Flavobacterium sp.]|nr:hypothetical protein [Flavobacterium sp.]